MDYFGYGRRYDSRDYIYCDTCDRKFLIITEGDTGGSYAADEDNAPNDQVTKCDQCPYSHHMCGFCIAKPTERECPEPWSCDECEAPLTSMEYENYCSLACEALSRGIPAGVA